MVSCFLVALYILKAREKIGDTMQDRDPFLFGMFNIGWVWERSSCPFLQDLQTSFSDSRNHDTVGGMLPFLP